MCFSKYLLGTSIHSFFFAQLLSLSLSLSLSLYTIIAIFGSLCSCLSPQCQHADMWDVTSDSEVAWWELFSSILLLRVSLVCIPTFQRSTKEKKNEKLRRKSWIWKKKRKKEKNKGRSTHKKYKTSVQITAAVAGSSSNSNHISNLNKHININIHTNIRTHTCKIYIYTYIYIYIQANFVNVKWTATTTTIGMTNF